jgi:LPXTG-site transpeptidase (sortase) family protein
MTDVLPRGNDMVASPYREPGGEYFSLDGPTKDLVRLLVGDGPAGTEQSGQPVDWDSIWSLAEGLHSEELALGSAALAAREALVGDPMTSPSTLLVRTKRPGPVSPARQPLIPAALPKPELQRRVLTAVAAATWVRNIGVIVVLFAVWQLWGTGIAEAHSQSHLKVQYALLLREQASGTGSAADQPTVAATASAPPVRLTAAATKPAAPTSPAEPLAAGVESVASDGAREANLYAQTRTFVEAAMPGGVLGRIRIPAIGEDRYFVEGVGEDQLSEGPGRYPGSGLPGQLGNLAIAGHRTTYGAPFFELGNVRVGDTVMVDVPQGRALYTVSQPPFAVSPYDTAVLDDYGDARLTLTTCNPPFFATTRLIVVAKLTDWLPTGARIPIPGPVPDPGHMRPRPRVAPLVAATAATPTAAAGASTALHPQLGIGRAQISPSKRLLGAAPVATAAKGTSGAARVNDTSTVAGLADEGAGWHFGELPLLFAVAIVLGALGAFYGRVARVFSGASRWLVMVPMWAAGLLVLFKVLGLFLPADL